VIDMFSFLHDVREPSGRFANPQVLWFLLVIPPAMVAFFWWSWRTRQRLMTQFIQARLLPALTVGISPTRQKIRLTCLVAAVACFIFALARPQLGFDWEEVKQRGLDVIVAIDTSKSMLAEDIAPNRLKRAKLAALDLMQQAKSDRLALIAFAGGAFLQCPLTIDDSAFRQSVDTLDVNIIPQGGTAIAEAIETALASFREGDNHKALVLFTDGEDQDSRAVEAAKRAGEAGIHIYTIGIGSTEGELLRITDAKGRTDYIRDEQGNVVKSHLNESLLREIAGATPGGFYLPLRGAKTMETLYEKGIGTLPKSETSEKLVRRYHERYHWPLAAGMLLLLIEMLFPERKRERSKGAMSAPAKAGLREAVALAAILAAVSAWGSPASALREYKDGKYDNALKDYQKALDKKKDDPRLHFNAGAAAYKSKNFEEAAKQFDEALNSPDLKLLQQSYYNRGNARYYLGESNPDPSKKTETWEEAVKDFESAMKLNAQDPDAKFNYDFVKKKLEELKQQQQQQKNDKNDQNKDDQDKQQQQQNKQDQDKKDQDKKDQQNKDQENKQDPAQNKDSQQQNDQQQKEQQQKEQAQKDKQEKQKQSAEQKKKEEQKAQQSSGKPDDKDKQEGQQTYAAGQMTPQQAQQLLDAEKGHEMMLPVKPEGKPRDPNKPLRDW